MVLELGYDTGYKGVRNKCVTILDGMAEDEWQQILFIKSCKIDSIARNMKYARYGTKHKAWDDSNANIMQQDGITGDEEGRSV